MDSWRRVDVPVLPGSGPAPRVHDTASGELVLAAVAGCPSITVPAGYVSGLPVGVSFFGPRWTEPRLLALAYGFEQATQARQLPTLAASVR